ncbi:uncharacterized protein A1O9_03866 [Exophiala aquamarina CBS 119918]|uniref:Major facilitator superfamily (MFS) profile domain-containing protein n=1 Tax=Exophiala aquamarina CBS 119918 TaxID=1182545 RepID=A0A072PI73_9EURO|nr:uncharacterized protein A1O9_03866 [Exophiala aquamarina CBS 119918]KEF59023.1 hypothetical protein A1O9_03866 [Exophiala aquamarina CBS 119918]
MSRDSQEGGPTATSAQPDRPPSRGRQRQRLHFASGVGLGSDGSSSSPGTAAPASSVPKWSLGILNDKTTDEVPGTVLLLSSARNEPLGLEPQHDQRKNSSMPAQLLSPRRPSRFDKKTTKCGSIILEPQPDDSKNDPLNWSTLRRDSSLLSLGFYCMLGGGITPILAAGFHDVADTYHVTYAQVTLTTGLYMMGLGVGSVLFSPTAILYGKRPVYLFSAILFILTSVWCALAPSYAQLATARVFQGISVSPVECLPSATIAEIFFLHERAFRVGIYTLLLLGGKNLVPLVSAVIIEAKGWRWVFWVVTMVAAFGMALLFFFVPETFWDRTPRPKARNLTARRSLSSIARHSLRRMSTSRRIPSPSSVGLEHEKAGNTVIPQPQNLQQDEIRPSLTDGAVDEKSGSVPEGNVQQTSSRPPSSNLGETAETLATDSQPSSGTVRKPTPLRLGPLSPELQTYSAPWDGASGANTPHLHNLNSPYYLDVEKRNGYLDHHSVPTTSNVQDRADRNSLTRNETTSTGGNGQTDLSDVGKSEEAKDAAKFTPKKPTRYTTNLRQSPPQGYLQTLKPWNGRLSPSKWGLVALRPFILFAYPAVLWAALVYSLSVGWLIVLSESISDIYRDRDSYSFTALQSGLVYISPFIGGILGTAVAGKVSDIIVRAMARRNGGVYEPEFRLVMGAPIAASTAIGLIGYGWSAEERDNWIVPTVFFGVISFGCSLGSTTSITFCVDSYRQFAGEALVTLNFSKNIFHGLVFSLFFAQWLESRGPKDTFVVIGILQIVCMLTTIPMYIYGKRLRMWTVRKRLMEKF